MNLKKQYQVSHYNTFSISFNISAKKAYSPPPEEGERKKGKEKKRIQDLNSKQT